MPLQGEIKQQELNGKPFLCSRNGASLQPSLSPVMALSRLPPTAWQPPLPSLCVPRCPPIEAVLHAPRHVYAVLPLSSLTVQFATGPLNISPRVQTLLRPCRVGKFLAPLLWLSWLVPERSSGSGFALAEEKVTAPATGGRRGQITY